MNKNASRVIFFQTMFFIFHLYVPIVFLPSADSYYFAQYIICRIIYRYCTVLCSLKSVALNSPKDTCEGYTLFSFSLFHFASIIRNVANLTRLTLYKLYKLCIINLLSLSFFLFPSPSIIWLTKMLSNFEIRTLKI